MSRRDFLKVGGAGLAGAALLGVAGCGGGDSGGGDSGSGEITFIYGPTGNTDQQTIQKLVDKFNNQNDSGINAKFR